MKNWLIRKDGWHVEIDRGGIPYWEEDEPQYKLPCIHCNSTGTTTNHDPDCIGMCFCPSENCPYCQGRGKQRSAPLTPIPDKEIINRLHDELAYTVKQFAEMLDSGILEKEIASDRAKEGSLEGASL